MRRASPIPVLAALGLILCLAACSPKTSRSSGAAGSGLDSAKLEAAIDARMGGADTCVVIEDTETGRGLYQYGDAGVCMRALPPCETFEVANDIIGLDSGLVTPQTVFKWDGKPQPVSLWQADADMSKAFKNAITWWDQRLAQSVGHDAYARELGALAYGDHDPAGPLQSFWLGPQAGGGLGISTRQQADFMRRFYTADLLAKAPSMAFVQSLLVGETRAEPGGGQATMTGKAGSCASISDGSRNVGWWTGRLVTAQHDLTFAASVEAAAAPPGFEVEQRIKDIFADAGLWPGES